MSEKEKINKEELEKVSGGVPYIGQSVPTKDSFYHKVNDVVNYCVYDPDYQTAFHINFKVVALGIIKTGSIGPVMGYNLLYKLETIDRSISKYDGWYDFELWVTSLRIKKVSPEGIIIVDEA